MVLEPSKKSQSQVPNFIFMSNFNIEKRISVSYCIVIDFITYTLNLLSYWFLLGRCRYRGVEKGCLGSMPGYNNGMTRSTLLRPIQP